MSASAVLRELAQATDPKQATIARIGNLEKHKLLSNRVLIATYIAPEKTKGGIIRIDSTVAEDIYQGSVGLVVKLGKTAFQDEPETKTYFHGQSVNIGDWVLYRPGDGKRVQINNVECRIIEDALIDMVIEDPSIITHSK